MLKKIENQRDPIFNNSRMTNLIIVNIRLNCYTDSSKYEQTDK